MAEETDYNIDAQKLIRINNGYYRFIDNIQVKDEPIDYDKERNVYEEELANSFSTSIDYYVGFRGIVRLSTPWKWKYFIDIFEKQIEMEFQRDSDICNLMPTSFAPTLTPLAQERAGKGACRFKLSPFHSERGAVSSTRECSAGDVLQGPSVQIFPGLRTVEMADAHTGNLFRRRHIAIHGHVGDLLRI